MKSSTLVCLCLYAYAAFWSKTLLICISMDRIILRSSHSKAIFVPYGNIKGHVPPSLLIPRAEKQKPLLYGKKRRHRPRFSSRSSLKRNRSDISLSVIWYVVSFRQKNTERPIERHDAFDVLVTKRSDPIV